VDTAVVDGVAVEEDNVTDSLVVVPEDIPEAHQLQVDTQHKHRVRTLSEGIHNNLEADSQPVEDLAVDIHQRRSGNFPGQSTAAHSQKEGHHTHIQEQVAGTMHIEVVPVRRNQELVHHMAVVHNMDPLACWQEARYKLLVAQMQLQQVAWHAVVAAHLLDGMATAASYWQAMTRASTVLPQSLARDW
jgi:hypothetical protein